MRSIIEKNANWVLVAIAAMFFSFGWGRIDVAPAQAELIPAAVGAGGLITHFYEKDAQTGRTRVVVVDPVQRRMAVYDINLDSGAIQLKSVRNMSVDLQVQDFNSGDPSPIDMQKMLERN